MRYRQERVLIETTRQRIIGYVTLPEKKDTFARGRFLDLLNNDRGPFFAITEATIEERDTGAAPIYREFVAVSRDHVLYATDAIDQDLDRQANGAAARLAT